MKIETVQDYARNALVAWGEGSWCEAIYLGDDEIDRPLCITRCTEHTNTQGTPFEFLPWLSLAALDVGLGSNAVSTFFGLGKPARLSELEEVEKIVADEDFQNPKHTTKLHLFAETRFDDDGKVKMNVQFFPFLGYKAGEIVFVEDPDVPDDSGQVPFLADHLNDRWAERGFKREDFGATAVKFTPKNLAARWAAWLDVCVGTIRMCAWVDPAVKHILENGKTRNPHSYVFDPIDEAGLHRVRLQDDEPPASPVGGW